MKYFCVLLILPVVALAANVLVWEYDSLDTFYDSQAGGTIDTPYWIQQTLTALGHAHTTTSTLPSNLAPYDAVFVLLGWFRC
ncbi:hypothetical protein A2Y85_07965 [candidate division WOR-3 bacterium RBG_13_43_14]|uniref:Uncharacterized protein n=1 Tax=candidate division WOR-3 bacterium RBG_13_43_14 TaxID=1802590 RepID=A0A1F4U8P1_UNCW3|nr:MAG: hypothetical protein A2Y85_07965 [candidate division WOR-3 bacterium RBG_13_43_14]